MQNYQAHDEAATIHAHLDAKGIDTDTSKLSGFEWADLYIEALFAKGLSNTEIEDIACEADKSWEMEFGGHLYQTAVLNRTNGRA